MNRNGIFWSVYMILIGVLLLIKLIFRLEFNWFSAAFAVLLLQCGAVLLISSSSARGPVFCSRGGVHMFMAGKIVPQSGDTRILAVFSDAQIELPAVLPPEMEISSILANTTLQLPAGWSARAETSCAFGQISTPEGNIDGFGDKVFIVGEGQQCRLRLNAVFGRLVIRD